MNESELILNYKLNIDWIFNLLSGIIKVIYYDYLTTKETFNDYLFILLYLKYSWCIILYVIDV